MTTTLERRLQKNIAKYSWYKVFTKRLYLPLITIQLVSVGQVSVQELAIIAIVSSIVQGLLQMPAGYFADRFGNRVSIILGAAIALPSPLLYVFMPNFWGGLIAAVLFFGGYAFQSGSIESFIHNTLIALKREKDYAKVMGRAQTYGLLANVVLIALVPATYVIDKSLPFLIGFLSLGAMLWLTISFVHPKQDTASTLTKNPIDAVRKVATLQNISIFLFAGFLAGVANRGGEFRELSLQAIGIPISWFGIILALSSLMGAAMGWYVHVLDRLRPLVFYLLDLLLLAGIFITMGLIHNLFVMAAVFIIYAGYTRIRMIIFQAKMLHDLKHAYKATLISALNLFALFGEMLVISLLTTFIDSSGFITGYLWFGLSVLGVGILLWLFLRQQVQQLRTS